MLRRAYVSEVLSSLLTCSFRNKHDKEQAGTTMTGSIFGSKPWTDTNTSGEIYTVTCTLWKNNNHVLPITSNLKFFSLGGKKASGSGWVSLMLENFCRWWMGHCNVIEPQQRSKLALANKSLLIS